MLRGVVHDPTARRMGGVAGHAGLFSTAADLTMFCRMLLGGGALGTTRILSPLAVARMTSPATPAGEANVRGLGWDLDSSYSANRGELLPLGSFGHTGFTGTSIWIDPATRVFIDLSVESRAPGRRGRRHAAARARRDHRRVAPRPMCRRTSTARGVQPPGVRPQTPAVPAPPVAARCSRASTSRAPTGLRCSRHSASGSSPTTPAAPATARRRSICSPPRPTCKLVALFSPEHGIRGILDAAVPSSKDEKTGLPIHSLYGTTQRPTADDARRARRDRDRPAGHRHALLHLHDDDGVRDGGGGGTQDQSRRARSSQPDRRRADRRPGARRGGDRLHRLLSADADPSQPDDGRAGAAVQRREEDRRGSHRDRDARLAARHLVRRDRPPVDQSVAEHAQPLRGHALSRHRRVRVHEPLGRPRHRYAVRARRRAVDRRRRAWPRP